MCFTGDMTFCDSKDTFLSNVQNKQRFIHLLSSALSQNGFQAVHARADADCLIAQETLEAAKSETTVLVGEDTDLLVLLLHHVKREHHDVFFSAGGVSGAKRAKVWNIKMVQQALGTEVCHRLLFAHAISGCDTTSRMFSIGKSQPLKKLKSENFKRQADVFASSHSSHEEVAEAGEKVIVSLYGGREGDTLDELRYVKYMQKVSTASKSTQPNVLPPTASAARYHSYRTYFQVQSWMCLNDNIEEKDPQQWGWEKQQEMLLPMFTDKAVAPEELLKVVRCNCKSGCGTAMCSCRKHGLVCSIGCGACRGDCLNSVNLLVIEGSEPDYDDED